MWTFSASSTSSCAAPLPSNLLAAIVAAQRHSPLKARDFKSGLPCRLKWSISVYISAKKKKKTDKSGRLKNEINSHDSKVFRCISLWYVGLGKKKRYKQVHSRAEWAINKIYTPVCMLACDPRTWVAIHIKRHSNQANRKHLKNISRVFLQSDLGDSKRK